MDQKMNVAMGNEEAKKHLRNGAYTAFILFGITSVVSAVAIYSNAKGDFGEIFNDPIVFVDAGIMLACGFGMLKGSRVAAIVVLLQVIFGILFTYSVTKQFSGAAFKIVYIYFFAQAIRGAFALHRIKRLEAPDTVKTRLWIKITGGVVGTVFLGLVAIGLASQYGILTATSVQTGSDLGDDLRTRFENNDVLLQNEIVEYYYLIGIVDTLEAGVILTDNAFLYYARNETDIVLVYEFGFDSIGSFELMTEGGALSEALYQLNDNDGDMLLQFPLSVEMERDEDMMAALERHIADAHQ